MDEITFSVFWHDRETKAWLVHSFYRSSRKGHEKHAFYRSSRMDRITKKKRSWKEAFYRSSRVDHITKKKRSWKARLMHAFYRSSRVDRITKKKGHALRLHACKCENKQDFPGFVVLSPKKKVFAIGLPALAHILGTASNCCCTADVYRPLIHLHAWFFLLHGQKCQ